MSDLTERVARMLAEYVEHASADQMVKGQGGDLEPFWTRQVPFARDVIRETVRAFVEETYTDLDPTFAENFLRKYGIEP